MSYLVSVSFDIKNGNFNGYQAVYAGFEKAGLSRTQTTSNGKTIHLPTTMVLGEFDGESSAKVRDDVSDQCIAVFQANNLKGELFLTVGTGWTWRHKDI
jgi:hypothetical protein